MRIKEEYTMEMQIERDRAEERERLDEEREEVAHEEWMASLSFAELAAYLSDCEWWRAEHEEWAAQPAGYLEARKAHLASLKEAA